MENEFAKIGSYQYSSEAIIVKGRLEAEGIEVFMEDGFTIDFGPLVSNAIGGVKLFVRSEDLVVANNVLAEISQYSLDSKGHPVTCPKCCSSTVNVFTTIKDRKALLSFLFGGVLFGTLPPYVKYVYRCNNCSNEFAIQ
ncbi:DUF2007 domain-containing protein [Flavobacterium sp.]|uniref:DUF2007 domain-containing protein n=1 Tax=Flavobacterium sp. TaxID=239 RepID=UPI004034413C